MNFANVLRELGAEDRELEHLLACDECSVWNGYDGAELERCEDNPLRVESRWVDALNRIGWGLMAAFEIPKPPKGAFGRLFESIVEDYKRSIAEQMMSPIFAQAMTRTDS